MARKGTAKDVFVQRALDMFLKNGVRTTMDDISRQLKISKRTIYEQFEDKTDLMRACVICLLKEEPELPAFNGERTLYELYCLLRENVMSLFGQRSTFIHNLNVYYPELFDELVKPVVDWAQNYIISSLRESMENGYVRTDVSLDVFFSYLLKFIFIITSDTENDFKKHTNYEIFQSTIVPMLRGVMTEKGIGTVRAKLDEK